MKHGKHSAGIWGSIMAVLMIFSLICGTGSVPSVYAADIHGSSEERSEDTVSALENPAAVSFQSYKLSAYNDPDTAYTEPEQHVLLTLTFSGPVTISDEDVLNSSLFGANPSLTITIAGRSISDSTYYRPCTYSVSGCDLLIDIGNVIVSGENHAFASTSIYNGSFTASGSISGISVNGTAVSSDVNISETRIPAGIEFTNVSGWNTNQVTMKVSHTANVRADYHFVVYNAITKTIQPPTVVPVTPDTGQMNAYTETENADHYNTMTTSDLASDIVSEMKRSLPAGYSASLDGSNFTVTSDNSADKLLIYVYDDNFIQSDRVYLATPDPGIGFVSIAGIGLTSTLNGTGTVIYGIHVNDTTGLAAWAANAAMTVDGIPYKIVLQEPSSYTVTDSTTGEKTNFAYLKKGSNQNDYYMILASSPLDCSGSQTTNHTIAITDKIGPALTGYVRINNFAANTFRVRYIDENEDTVSSKLYSLDELKTKFTSVTQDYTIADTTSGLHTVHAEGVPLNDLLSDCGITINDNMTVEVRSNEATIMHQNNPDDSVGDLSEGYYEHNPSLTSISTMLRGIGQIDSADLFDARYYYPSVYDNSTTYSGLNGSTIYDTLKSVGGMLLQTDGQNADTSEKLRKALASSADKEAVTPLIAWQYSESVFGSDGTAVNTSYDSRIAEDNSFRFLLGMKEENGEASLQPTALYANKYVFGIDIIENGEAVKNAREKINAITEPVTLADKDVIEAARTAYDAVPSESRYKVNNWNILNTAETEYGALYVTDLINKIGTPVTKDSGAAITAARNAYDALSYDSKSKVANYDVLTAAETAFRATRVSNIFTDVHEKDWYNDSVQFVYDNNIMTGKSAAVFAPEATMTRAEFVTVLYRMSGSPGIAYTDKFNDVPENMFYSLPVLWASQESTGIVYGYGNGNFGPNDTITREQLTVMLFRYAKHKGIDISAADDLSSFPDKNRVNSFALDSMQWAVGTGLITGDGGRLNPQGTATRGQAATIIYRLMKK